ncbi:MAG: hypothetical protein QN155_12105 [Armatimonadota bacterium]|nr:hypothetical protein [Armatimonadota bacterium]
MGTRLVRYLETNFSPRPPRAGVPPARRGSTALPDGARVVVVGGGIAGSAFCRQLLTLSQEQGRRVTLYLVNSTNCNYCGGLVTGVARETLAGLYGLDIPADLILRQVKSCVYLNAAGGVEVALHTPMTAILRTSRFGIPGFDDAIKERITAGLRPPWSESLVDLEPTIVTSVARPDPRGPWLVTLSRKAPDGSPVRLEADVLVMAAGFKSLRRPMLQEFQELTGFRPPPVMPASVTEIDTGKARYNEIGNRMFIADGIIPGCIVAFIPKGERWVTVTSLGRRLEKSDLDAIFAHPSVKRYIDLPDASQTPRCHTVCGANVFTGPSARFYGDGWLVLGDLAGYGRVLKDGYYAAFLQGRLAAEALVYHGTGRASLARHYHRPLRRFLLDNRVGMALYRANRWLENKSWFGRFLISAAGEESRRNPYGGPVHGAIRALASGELNYRLILALFVHGLLGHALRHPGRALAAWFPRRKGAGGRTEPM